MRGLQLPLGIFISMDIWVVRVKGIREYPSEAEDRSLLQHPRSRAWQRRSARNVSKKQRMRDYDYRLRRLSRSGVWNEKPKKKGRGLLKSSVGKKRRHGN